MGIGGGGRGKEAGLEGAAATAEPAATRRKEKRNERLARAHVWEEGKIWGRRRGRVEEEEEERWPYSESLQCFFSVLPIPAPTCKEVPLCVGGEGGGEESRTLSIWCALIGIGR